MLHILSIDSISIARVAVISQRTGSDLFAGVKAMMILNLKEKMTSGSAHFLYLKKDGSIREAWGTLNRSLVEKHTNGRGESRENFATCAYFDIEKAKWRSFRWESIIKVF